MIKAFHVNLLSDVKTLVWKATKNDTLVKIRSHETGILLGDATLTEMNSFEMICNENFEVRLANNDELYAMMPKTTNHICVLVQV